MQIVISKFALFFLLSLTIYTLKAQVVEQWSRRYNGPANKIDLLTTMIVDDQGNIYIAGRSDGINTNQDFCIIKYSSSGNKDLVLRFDGEISSWDEIYNIAVDESGNIYATGISHYSAMIIKYNSSGTLLWNIEKNNGTGKCIRVNQSGDLLVGINKTTGDGSEILIDKISPAGTEIWSSTIRQDSIYGDELIDMQIDRFGNIYLTGQTHNQDWEDEFIFSDIITVKLNSDGSEMWRKTYSATSQSDDIPLKLCLDSRGNIIIGARTNTNPSGFIVLKYSENGDTVWTRIYNGQYCEDIATDITVDSDDNIIITGYSFTADEDFNILTVKYDSSGNELWAVQYNGPGNTRDFAFSLTSDSLNNVYITGGSRHGSSGIDTCITVKYDQDGNEIWSVSYSDSLGLSSCGKYISLDNCGDIIIAANSIGNDSGWDFLTIKYCQNKLDIFNNIQIESRLYLYNYPNPFNPITTIVYNLDKETDVSVQIYDLLGKQITQLVNDRQLPGFYKIQWNGKDQYGNLLPSGIYFCLLKTTTQIQSKKLIFLR